MAQEHINWTVRIQEGVNVAFYTHVPTDITFIIEENGSIFKIEAHKIFMGFASRVFNRMFFVADTNDKDAKEIVVKETTPQAFQIMKDAIYNTQLIKDSLNSKSVPEVFAVLDLVTRYEIPELVMAVHKYLASFPVTEDNVLDVAEDATLYTETFTDEAKALLIKCAEFLKPKFSDAQSVFKYVAENRDRGDIVVELQVLMKDVAPMTPPGCTNCQQEQCLDGQVVQENQARVGLVVTNNIGVFGKVSLGTARLIHVLGNGKLTLESIKQGDTGRRFSGGTYSFLRNTFPTGPSLLFHCK